MTHLGNPPRSSRKILGQLYLWLAILIFGASSAVTRKLTEIGAQHSINGQNPISLCNVLFVGNLCALLVLIVIYGQQWNRATLRQISKKEWGSLIAVAILSGAIAPGLIFQALALTQVNNVVLVGRLEPPLTLALSVWLLQERVNRWEVIGAIVASVGVVLTISVHSPGQAMMQVGMFRVGVGELFAAVGAIAASVSTIIGKKLLSQVPLGIYSIVRTALGTVVFFISALILYGNQHFANVLSPFLWEWMLVYGTVIVVVGQSFWIKGLRASTVSTASIVSSFTPLVAILAAYWILGEAPTRKQYGAGSVILVGLFFSQIGIQRQAARMAICQASMQAQQLIDTKVGFKGV